MAGQPSPNRELTLINGRAKYALRSLGVVGQSSNSQSYRKSIMYHVYLIRSLEYPDKTYIGFTNNLEQRMEKHNNGASIHTSDHRPWKLVTYISFDDEKKAVLFEKYLKVGSGHAFAQRRLW